MGLVVRRARDLLRHSNNLSLVSAAGGLALVTTVAFGVAVMQGYGHGAPGPQFAGSPADQVPATSPELGLAGGDSPVPSLFSGAPESGYKALLTFIDAAGSSTLQVIIGPAPMPAETECAKNTLTMSCTLEIMADGTKIYRATMVEAGAATYAVEVYHPDGTHVWLIETNVESGEQDPQAKQPGPFVLTRPTPLLDLVALVSLAQADTLTLFP